ncbi:sugar transferase [Albirhodobacter sp. R86504]|uniref:sugar transferase n=1 Tax=Albirhodobacter sp. R86504 TaxID=3093848 RepID=UPI003670B820
MSYTEILLKKEVSSHGDESIRSAHSRKKPQKGRSLMSFSYNNFGKRVLDIAFSLVLMPVLLPVLLAIWVAIRLNGGAATFTQPRVGRNGRVFNCYKFRSMVPDAERVLADMCASNPIIAQEWAANQKLRDDPRITKVGKFIRKTSLDELPQIVNVLRGDMSLVGPRPFLPSQKEIYDALGGKAYYSLRPGITGLWQICSRNDTTFAARVRFDEEYARNLSASNDVSLILNTAKVVVQHTGA